MFLENAYSGFLVPLFFVFVLFLLFVCCVFMLRSNTFCDSYFESNGFFSSSCFSISAFIFELYCAFGGVLTLH